MVTIVGTQSDFSDAMQQLAELDLDAIGAYEAAIERIENNEYKAKLSEFKKDHGRHVQEINALLRQHGKDEITKSDMSKSLLAKGKVVLASVVGDNLILTAMLDNERDTNSAYERMDSRTDQWPNASEVIAHGLQDEKRHKAWLESIIK